MRYLSKRTGRYRDKNPNSPNTHRIADDDYQFVIFLTEFPETGTIYCSACFDSKCKHVKFLRRHLTSSQETTHGKSHSSIR